MSSGSIALVLVLGAILLAGLAAAQTPTPDPGCNGIQLNYNLQTSTKIRPFVSNQSKQPYSFTATASIVNGGTRPLKSWAMLVTFGNDEILVGIDGAVLTAGAELPYNTTENATSFSGYPQTDLLTPIATAGDIAQIQASVAVRGTLFGKVPAPLPAALTLDDSDYDCPPATNATASLLSTCCLLTPNAMANTTDPTNKNFLPRGNANGNGDLVITYDVIQAYPSSYLALVTLENNVVIC